MWLPWVVVAAALVVIVAIGLDQARDANGPSEPTVSRLGAQRQTGLEGAPPALAAVRRQANELLPGARKALLARVHALRGYPVVINVWAAWCGPCRVELPILQRASLKWGKRVAFLGVDLRDDRGNAESLLHEIPLTYPSYEDPRGQVLREYRLLGTPSTIYYDAAGKETYVRAGAYARREQLEADIERHAVSPPRQVRTESGRGGSVGR
jgi:cytochrome c biogenesis protein CcmG/thiol:disulfide interchange protein DsbE